MLQEYRQELNNGVAAEGQVYTGNPCIYGVFDAYTNKYLIAMEEINRYATPSTTTTSTTTTIAIHTFTAATSTISSSDVCSNPEAPAYLFNIVGGVGTTMCDNVQLRSIYIELLNPGDHFWTYNGVNVREWQVLLSSGGYNYAIAYNICGVCSGTTTTTTTTGPTTTTTTIAPTTTTTTLAYTSIGTTPKINGATDCTEIGTSPEIFLDVADYALFVSFGGCLSNGISNVAVIRNSDGTPISGTFYFVYYGGSCSTTTFKSTIGNLTVNPTQC